MIQSKDVDWLNGNKNKTHVFSVFKRPTLDLETHTTPWREKRRYSTDGNEKKVGVTVLISEKIDFKIKTVTRVKEGYYIMIKESIQEEDRTSVNIHTPKRGGPQHTREILTGIQEETDSDAIIIGEVNSPISSMNRSPRQKINKETQALNDTKT